MTREEAIKTIKSATVYTPEEMEALETLIPELAESEDERIRKFIQNELVCLRASEDKGSERYNELSSAVAYLEKQKDASKAIEAVDRIDKYIDEHLANAHDMKDSNPDKKYYRGWDDALGKMSGILQDVYSGEKKKESLRDFIDNFPYSDKQKEQDKCPEYCVRSHCMGCSIYEKQKEQKPSIFPPDLGEVHWNPIPSGKDVHKWNLPEDFEEAVYKVANFISPFDSQDELRRVSHRFAEQLMSLAKKELVKKPVEEDVYPATLDEAIKLYYETYGNGKGSFEWLSYSKKETERWTRQVKSAPSAERKCKSRKEL